jgi:ribosomal-protein-alanine N-acetyltransferase
MEFASVIPVLRSFDTDTATRFYVDYLGMTADWEHRFGHDFPLYRQVSRDGLVLHLSEHHGDATPGSTVYVRMRGVRELHAELTERWTIGRNRPGLTEQEWGALEFSVTDPFGNTLRFGESTST